MLLLIPLFLCFTSLKLFFVLQKLGVMVKIMWSLNSPWFILISIIRNVFVDLHRIIYWIDFSHCCNRIVSLLFLFWYQFWLEEWLTSFLVNQVVLFVFTEFKIFYTVLHPFPNILLLILLREIGQTLQGDMLLSSRFSSGEHCGFKRRSFFIFNLFTQIF